MTQIEVYGTPAPQGSKRVVRGRLIDTNQQSLRDWRNLIAFSAQGGEVRLIPGPIRVITRFYLARPKHHFGSGKNAERLKPSAPSLPRGTPDLDKLVRAVLDALTGVAFNDDSQVTTLIASKYYADQRGPGAEIEVEALEHLS